MIEKKLFRILIALVMAAVIVSAAAGCQVKRGEKEAEEPEGQEEVEEEEEEDEAAALTPDQVDALMWQISDKEVDLRFKEYVPDEGFARAEIFGIDRDGDEGTAYVNLYTGEYVVVEDNAYNVSGSQGEAIIKFKYTDDVPEFEELIWSADGEDHDQWLEENFPEEYLEKAEEYQSHNDEGISALQEEVETEVKNEMGVPVETENLLEIYDEEGTYKIVKVTESGDPGDDDYKFETETIRKGKLKDLK